MKRVLAYARVSTLEQYQDGISLDVQAATVRAYCTSRQLDIVEDRGVSAGKPLRERTGGAQLLATVDAGGIDGVVATRLDRMFRNTEDCLHVTGAWQRQGVALHLVDLGGASVDTASPFGAFMLTVLAAVGASERSDGPRANPCSDAPQEGDGPMDWRVCPVWLRCR